MAKSKFKTMKVFDCQDMPSYTRTAFFDYIRSGGHTANDCYVDFQRDKEVQDYYNSRKHHDAKRFLIVNKWLIKNGASKYEDVLINFNW